MSRSENIPIYGQRLEISILKTVNGIIGKSVKIYCNSML